MQREGIPKSLWLVQYNYLGLVNTSHDGIQIYRALN